MKSFPSDDIKPESNDNDTVGPLTTKPIFGDLSLLALMPVLKGIDSSRKIIWGIDCSSLSCIDGHTLIIVLAVNIEFLVMTRKVVNIDAVQYLFPNLRSSRVLLITIIPAITIPSRLGHYKSFFPT